MESTSDRLRRARELKKLSLREVATATKISVTTLEALERGDFSRVPGGIYGRSFVRAYAEILELPADQVVEAYGAELAQFQRDAARQQAKPRVTAGDREFLAQQQRAMRALRYGAAAVLVLLILLALAWWGWWSRREGASDAADPGTTTTPASASRFGP